MQTIANSSLFIGTSLHGIITAMSFNVPYLGINPKVYYLDTWAPEELKTIAPADKFSNYTTNALEVLQQALIESSERQKKLASKSFEEIHTNIQNI